MLTYLNSLIFNSNFKADRNASVTNRRVTLSTRNTIKIDAHQTDRVIRVRLPHKATSDFDLWERKGRCNAFMFDTLFDFTLLQYCLL